MEKEHLKLVKNEPETVRERRLVKKLGGITAQTVGLMILIAVVIIGICFGLIKIAANFVSWVFR